MPSGYRLLIADDEPIEREALRFFVSSYGRFSECEEAEDGLAAVDAASRFKPDVMILDIRMPGMDGIEAARAVRLFDGRVRIVFLTAFGELDYARAAFKVDAADFLLKPLSEESFREAMDRALSDLREAGAALASLVDALREIVGRAAASLRADDAASAAEELFSLFGEEGTGGAGLSEARRIADAIVDELGRAPPPAGLGIDPARLEAARTQVRRARGRPELFEAVRSLVAGIRADMGGSRRDPGRKAIEAAMAYIDKESFDAVSLEEASRIACMSRYHFSRVFHRETGMTFVDYARRRRVECAKGLLADPAIPIKRICDLAGFSTPAYFASAFRKVERMSPSEYRALHRKGARKPLIGERGAEP